MQRGNSEALSASGGYSVRFDDETPPPVAPRPPPVSPPSTKSVRMRPNKEGVKLKAMRVRSLGDKDVLYTAVRRPPSKTTGTGVSSEDVYLHPDDIACVPASVRSKTMTYPNYSRLMTRPDITQNAYSLGLGGPTQPASAPADGRRPYFENRHNGIETKEMVNKGTMNVGPMETAVYGAADGRGSNIVMEWSSLVDKMNKFYSTVINSNENDPEIVDFKVHLKINKNCNITDTLMAAYEQISPENELDKNPYNLEKEIYVVDFTKIKSSISLREQILKLFIKSSPNSNTCFKVTLKMDAMIRRLCDVAVELKHYTHHEIQSPLHIQSLLKGDREEMDILIRIFQENQLWIKWGTKTGLPPMLHLYMLKTPPSYEIRKAVTLAMISEKRETLIKTLQVCNRTEQFIPPIYSRLTEPSKNKKEWQATTYNKETFQFETFPCSLPHWVEDCPRLMSHLLSNNRARFKKDGHLYALYSVYIIVIKEFSVDEVSDKLLKENKMPSTYQIYVGCSTTGVLFRFAKIEQSHCENMQNIIRVATTSTNFRCVENCDLVDACMVQAYLNRNSTAVFVINTFHEEGMESLPLDAKTKFHEKMKLLQSHFVNSKKLGCLTDMRYGMNY